MRRRSLAGTVLSPLLAAALAIAGCSSTRDKPITSVSAGGRTLEYGCTSYKPGLSNATYVSDCYESLSLTVTSDPKKTGATFWTADRADCGKVRAACAKEAGVVRTREDGDVLHVAVGRTGASTGAFTLYFVKDLERPLWWKDEPGVDAATALAAMPPIDVAIDARLTGTEPPKWMGFPYDSTSPYNRDGDGLADILALPTRLAAHLSPVAAAMRKGQCFPEQAMKAVAADQRPGAGATAIYEGARAGCDASVRFIEAHKPPELGARILADLRAAAVTDGYLSRLAVLYELHEAAPLIEAKLAALPTGPVWLGEVKAIAALDPGRGALLLLGALAKAPGKSYVECMYPDAQGTSFNWRGEEDYFALVLGSALRDLDSLATRNALVAIGKDAGASAASKQIAVYLLVLFGERADDARLTACQKQRLESDVALRRTAGAGGGMSVAAADAGHPRDSGR